jgi:hypothetical protein
MEAPTHVDFTPNELRLISKRKRRKPDPNQRRKWYPVGQPIQIWMESRSMTELMDHFRYIGQQRWKNATAFDKKVAGNSLAPYRLTKQEACQRLERARAVKARKRFEKQMYTLDLSTRPRLPR